MSKKQIAILAGLGLAVVFVLCLAAYIVISEESAYQPVATWQPTWTPTLTPVPTWPPTWTPMPVPPTSTPTLTATPMPTNTPTPDYSDYFRDVDIVDNAALALYEETNAYLNTYNVDLICSRTEYWRSFIQKCRASWNSLTPPPGLRDWHDLKSSALDDDIVYYDNLALGCQTGDRDYYWNQAIIVGDQAIAKRKRALQMFEDYMKQHGQ